MLKKALHKSTMLSKLIPAMTYSPTVCPCSTFGAGALHFRVRHGYGCCFSASITGNPFSAFTFKTTQNLSFGQDLDLLVLGSSIHYCTSTSNLSTKSSFWGLQEIPHLKGSFALRCFQRLSRPYLAFQPCPWRNNWHTSDTSTPVLSY